MYRCDRFDTPIGPMTVVVNAQDALCFAGFDADHPKATKQLEAYTTVDGPPTEVAGAAGIRDRFRRYFAGEIEALSAVAVAPLGTAFQHAVWRELRLIPTGQTRSYGNLAMSLGKKGASRAVGAANGLNPIAIVVPCHRVIGSDGSLTGYAGGLDRKRWLLTHEGALPARLL